MLYRLDRLTIWLTWIVLASVFFTAFPLGPFGLLGWLGAVGPLMHKIAPGVGARRMAVLGLSLMVMIILLGDVQGWLQILVPPAVLLFGLLLAPVPIAGGAERLQDGGPAMPEEEFQLALTREIGRARRYERPLTLISASCDSESLSALEAAITSEVHLYAQLFHIDDRLLTIVPELDAEDYPALQRRILEAAKGHHVGSVALGTASFPAGEFTASGLVEIADSSRQLISGDTDAGLTADGDRSAGDYGTGLPSP